MGNEKLLVIGIVTKVVDADDPLNKHGTPFSFTNVVWTNRECQLKEGEGISFDHKVWAHESPPHEGSFVILEEFELKRHKQETLWRALKARRLDPVDKIPDELREKLKNLQKEGKEVRRE